MAYNKNGFDIDVRESVVRWVRGLWLAGTTSVELPKMPAARRAVVEDIPTVSSGRMVILQGPIAAQVPTLAVQRTRTHVQIRPLSNH